MVIVVRVHKVRAADKASAAAEIVRAVIVADDQVEIAGIVVKADAPASVEAADRVPSVALQPISSSKS